MGGDNYFIFQMINIFLNFKLYFIVDGSEGCISCCSLIKYLGKYFNLFSLK